MPFAQTGRHTFVRSTILELGELDGEDRSVAEDLMNRFREDLEAHSRHAPKGVEFLAGWKEDLGAALLRDLEQRLGASEARELVVVCSMITIHDPMFYDTVMIQEQRFTMMRSHRSP